MSPSRIPDFERSSVQPECSPKLFPPPPTLPPTPPSDRITLQVGDQRFTTTKSTLTPESGYFAALLSPRWPDQRDASGAYFVDADPALFTHVLRYLQRGLLPILYSSAAGHDYGTYHALLEEARYLQIPRLERYLARQDYHRAVRTRVHVGVEEILLEEGGALEFYAELGSDQRVDFQQASAEPTRCQKMQYMCPRGLRAHIVKGEKCDNECRDAQAGRPRQYRDIEVWRTVIVRSTTVVGGAEDVVDDDGGQDAVVDGGGDSKGVDSHKDGGVGALHGMMRAGSEAGRGYEIAVRCLPQADDFNEAAIGEVGDGAEDLPSWGATT